VKPQDPPGEPVALGNMSHPFNVARRHELGAKRSLSRGLVFRLILIINIAARIRRSRWR
jgi:hypothetical protein